MRKLLIAAAMASLVSQPAISQKKETPVPEKQAQGTAKEELKKLLNDKEKIKSYTKKIKDAIEADPAPKGDAAATIKYEDDEQIVTQLSRSMHRRLKAITVPIQDYDTQQMVPGILVVAGAVKRGKGEILYCPAKKDEATLSILALFVPEAVDMGVDWLTGLITEYKQMEQLAVDAASYNLLVYVQEDGRYATKLEFRKKDRGKKC